MASHTLVIVLLAVIITHQTEAERVSKFANAIKDRAKVLIDFIMQDTIDTLKEILHPPTNQNLSMQYILFTPENPNEPCYIEPNLKTLYRCSFNGKYPLKFLINGYRENLDRYWPIKDRMLEFYNYNVIVVNWSNYNLLPYLLACANAVNVGKNIAEFIQFLQKKTGIRAQAIHLIGHSLGAHVAGATGRRILNLERITGLDPAGPLYYPFKLFPTLSYKDANFVDVIHTSDLKTGLGYPGPLGDMDFFLNGGKNQPKCQTPGANDTGRVSVYSRYCNHQASIAYFKESINPTECSFRSIMCSNYADFLDGLCTTDLFPVAEMGLHAKPIRGLYPKSKFYLQTCE